LAKSIWTSDENTIRLCWSKSNFWNKAFHVNQPFPLHEFENSFCEKWIIKSSWKAYRTKPTREKFLSTSLNWHNQHEQLKMPHTPWLIVIEDFRWSLLFFAMYCVSFATDFQKADLNHIFERKTNLYVQTQVAILILHFFCSPLPEPEMGHIRFWNTILFVTLWHKRSYIIEKKWKQNTNSRRNKHMLLESTLFWSVSYS